MLKGKCIVLKYLQDWDIHKHSAFQPCCQASLVLHNPLLQTHLIKVSAGIRIVIGQIRHVQLIKRTIAEISEILISEIYY